MSSMEGADDACPIHDGFLQALLHLQDKCNLNRSIFLDPSKKCTCVLHRILINVYKYAKKQRKSINKIIFHIFKPFIET